MNVIYKLQNPDFMPIYIFITAKIMIYIYLKRLL